MSVEVLSKPWRSAALPRRGAHASWLIAGGADLKAVMDRLGHKEMQPNRQYLGGLPDADDRALAAFEAVRGRRLQLRPELVQVRPASLLSRIRLLVRAAVSRAIWALCPV